MFKYLYQLIFVKKKSGGNCWCGNPFPDSADNGEVIYLHQDMAMTCKLEDTFFNSPQFIPGTGQHAVDINLRIFTIRT